MLNQQKHLTLDLKYSTTMASAIRKHYITLVILNITKHLLLIRSKLV